MPARYIRQLSVPEFGMEGQRCLANADIAILGCGGLGCLQSEWLVRMGVGKLRIADFDHVTLDNLHRQMLFTEEDVAQRRLKVEAATKRLTQLNHSVEITPYATRIDADNITRFAAGADLILDATDHTPTRFMLNSFCLKQGIPWVYTGVAGTSGMVIPFTPPHGPCLRCLFPDPPAHHETLNCSTDGILPLTVTMAVSLQLATALKLLLGKQPTSIMLRFDVWNTTIKTVSFKKNSKCSCCVNSTLDHDHGKE